MVAAAPVSKGTVGNQPQSNPLDYRWAEKMVSERGISPRHDKLTGGYFAGWVAYTWFDSNGVNLAVSRRGVVVQVSGDATRAEVIAVANSLERVAQ